ncbi:fungal-specific transcription factor domain-containing protein [Hypoxylon trugodes]|uniref:fungal-specific transcription factor domain-containing protein n=1 Tax=Hypoxylon trugodes TaxID=326681 RepID=UPI00218E7847|nr:fungal-specific transcription factor domain-containing protein [Hypoxylon trugodes]KAI1387013.1 fungal-specific transcription factor domain-containing protein [Hypoxylon trugodes]
MEVVREDNSDDDRQDADGESVSQIMEPEDHSSLERRRRIMKRGAAACSRCRKRKQKCDGRLPTCSPCSTAGAVCVPSERFLRRNPSCNCAELREQVNALNNQVAELTSRLAEKRSHAQTNLDGYNPPSPTISQSVDRDETVEKSCTVRILRPTFPRKTSENGFLSSPWHLWGNIDDRTLTDHSIHGISWNSSQAVWPQLIDVFFSRRWPQLPVIHKPTFLQKHFIPFSENRSDCSPSSFQVNIVLAIAAAEKTVLDDDSVLSHHDYFKIATQSLEAVFAADDIDCVQSLLLLAMYGSHEPQYVDMWYTVGLALRLAVGIDLHRQEAIEGCNVLEAEMRKRLWWSVYVMDRSMSVALGRPLGIQDSDITMPLPESLTDDQLSNLELPIVPNLIPSTSDTSTFIHIIKLRRIYTDAYKVFHSVGQTNIGGEDDLGIIRHQHLLRFNDWLVGAPRYFNQQCMFQTPEWFQIAYHQAVITLHRPSRATTVNTIDEIRLCIDSSISLISCYSALYARNKITYTFVALNSLFMAAVTMLHALRASRVIRQELTKPVAESNILLCTKLLRDMSNGRTVGNSSAQIIERLGKAILDIFDNDPAVDQEIDTEFLLWFGLKSQHPPQQGQPTPSVDLAWNELLAKGFDMNGGMWTDLFL